MRKPNVKIQLLTEKEPLEQYDSPYGEVIEVRQNDYAIGIGRFLIAFSYLENALDSLIAQSIHSNTDEPGYRVIKYLNYRNKVNLASDTHKQMISFIQKEILRKSTTKNLNIIIEKLVELGEFRNKIAHANWMTVDKKGYVRVKIGEDSNRGGVIFNKAKITPGIIYKFTRQCHAVANRIDSFKEKIWQSI